ncbi:unnamed protein product [Pedinophyceae sp. YPF-701]|nr:unnamed protein product [Pedinophyceae sp. YPF-701]
MPVLLSMLPPQLSSGGGLAVGVGVAIGAVGATVIMRRPRGSPPDLHYAAAELNRRLVESMPSLRKPYQAPALLRNGHVETIWAAFFRKGLGIEYRREVVIMKDGGAVALDWPVGLPELPADAPVVVLLPGLTGGSHDTYVQHAVGRLWRAGIRSVVFNSRGTSDSPVTTPQFYSASFTGDTREVVAHVAAAVHPDAPLMAAGWSLGANILVRYLGEEGARTPLTAAVSMCNPFDLVVADRNFNRGFNNIYNWNLAKALRKIFRKHAALFTEIGGEYQEMHAASAKTIRDFDDAITRVSFGWPSVDAYYAGSGSHLAIPDVSIPLLCIQARDDPIAPEEAIPYDAIDRNPNCVLAVTPHGGHLGWVTTEGGLTGAPWTDNAVAEYFNAVLGAVPAKTRGGAAAEDGEAAGAPLSGRGGLAQSDSDEVRKIMELQGRLEALSKENFALRAEVLELSGGSAADVAQAAASRGGSGSRDTS